MTDADPATHGTDAGLREAGRQIADGTEELIRANMTSTKVDCETLSPLDGRACRFDAMMQLRT